MSEKHEIEVRLLSLAQKTYFIPKTILNISVKKFFRATKPQPNQRKISLMALSAVLREARLKSSDWKYLLKPLMLTAYLFSEIFQSAAGFIAFHDILFLKFSI